MTSYDLVRYTNCNEKGEPTCYAKAIKSFSGSEGSLEDLAPFFQLHYAGQVIAFQDSVFVVPSSICDALTQLEI